MPTLPPELAAFSYLLDTQPAPVRDAFHYCLCLLMVEACKMRLVEKVPGEPVPANGPGNGESLRVRDMWGSLQRGGAEAEQGVEGGAD